VVKVNAMKNITILACYFAIMSFSVHAVESFPDKTHDGLVLKPGTEATAVYINPAADFSQYNKMMIQETHVAFHRDWRRKHRRLTSLDIASIKQRIIKLLQNEFVDVLEKGGYQIVNQPGDNVLLLKPAIVDMEISSPVDAMGIPTVTYTTNVGSATLFLEMYDSITSEILARAIDKRVMESSEGHWQVKGSVVNNMSEGTKAIRRWATLLKEGLDRTRGKQN